MNSTALHLFIIRVLQCKGRGHRTNFACWEFCIFYFFHFSSLGQVLNSTRVLILQNILYLTIETRSTSPVNIFHSCKISSCGWYFSLTLVFTRNTPSPILFLFCTFSIILLKGINLLPGALTHRGEKMNCSKGNHQHQLRSSRSISAKSTGRRRRPELTIVKLNIIVKYAEKMNIMARLLRALVWMERRER